MYVLFIDLIDFNFLFYFFLSFSLRDILWYNS